MIEIDVQDMSCSHCVATISKALLYADHSARFSIELERKRVLIQTSALDVAALMQVLVRAGYTPALLPGSRV